MAADDDAERNRIRTKLYAPPKTRRRPNPGGPRPRQAGTGMKRGDAMALMAQLAAQDAQLGAG
ncbi:hypothetical protein ACFVHS_14805 [Streptomyces sp. NPDC057746]|uniref:hypothetical protein n=1 Tax=Streptomyces sp. NPDC057746 TaxID=3346237 RepID=UPI0036C1C0E4